jgi:hypothetical protein
VSSDDPAEGLADRPKMAEALASLKEGLAENDDPFYDGWKLKNGGAAAGENLAAARDAARAEGDATDTVPVRVVRYPVFPRWAIVAAMALVAFAVVVTAVRLMSRAPVPTTSLKSEPSTERITSIDDGPAPLPVVSSSEPAVSSSTPLPHKAKGKKAKPQDPGFFRDPGF